MATPIVRKRPFQGESCLLSLNSHSLSSSSPWKAARLLAKKEGHDEEVVPNKKSQDGVIDLVFSPDAKQQQHPTNLKNDMDQDESSDDDEVQFVGETKSKKSVHFSEIEHEIFYFNTSPFEHHASPSLATIDEQASINSSGIHPSSDHNSRATADYTVLSSNHGRARRQLRRISKHDLKAAVKHGQRFPAHPGRNGERRWKIVHNGLVYITDETMRQEITSYREEITIDQYPVSITMMEHHTELKRILKEEPYLCTGHTYIIVDQSGSMREADVDGFRSRSHAAYGTLSLEFIAEQLSQRPNQNDLFAESVTVIEMREDGQAIFDRVPFDWILFNRLLKRPNLSRPCFHGNYNKSLTLASQMILKEHHNLLNDGAEHGELPNFSLVFLSDGKPSDFTPGRDREERISILTTLTESLGDKFSLFAMGIGARETEFEQLQLMVDTVTKCGGQGQFVHAGVSTVKLSQTFSQISSTLTSHRTTLLGDGTLTSANNARTNNPAKVAKDVQMRETGKIVGKRFPSEKFVLGKDYTITRHRFDKDRNKFKDVSLATHGANGIEIETKPFGKGSERLAYRFHEIKQDNFGHKKVGKMMVAKNSVHLYESETKEAFHKEFCLVQSTAYDLAEKFNVAVRAAPLLQSVFNLSHTYHSRPPMLKFVLPHVYTIKDNATGDEKAYLVERMLPGKFTKYNSNNGYVRGAKDGVHNTRSIELQCGKVNLEEFVQAFSHWVYEHTNHKMLVCDLQGVLNAEGRHPEFQLTDPAICTRKGTRYGKTDMRLNGIRRWCSTHRCGLVCKGLGLSLINKSDQLLENEKKKPAFTIDRTGVSS